MPRPATINEHRTTNDGTVVLIVDGKGRRAQFEVDAASYPSVSRYRWILYYFKGKTYARAFINGAYVYLHRFILADELRAGLVADHINGDSQDNRRSNLRAVTQAQNCSNRNPNRNASNPTNIRRVWSTEWPFAFTRDQLPRPLENFARLAAGCARDGYRIEVNSPRRPSTRETTLDRSTSMINAMNLTVELWRTAPPTERGRLMSYWRKNELVTLKTLFRTSNGHKLKRDPHAAIGYRDLARIFPAAIWCDYKPTKRVFTAAMSVNGVKSMPIKRDGRTFRAYVGIGHAPRKQNETLLEMRPATVAAQPASPTVDVNAPEITPTVSRAASTVTSRPRAIGPPVIAPAPRKEPAASH